MEEAKAEAKAVVLVEDKEAKETMEGEGASQTLSLESCKINTTN